MIRTATPSISLAKLEVYFNFWPTWKFEDYRIGKSDFSILGLSELDFVEIGAHAWVEEDGR